MSAHLGREPGEGQLSLIDESVIHGPVDIDRARNALSRTLTPEYLGLDPSSYADITGPMVEYVQPGRLRTHLVDLPGGQNHNPFAVAYTDRGINRERYIAFTPKEAQIIPRSVSGLARNSEIRARARVTGFATEGDIARGRQAGTQSFESKLPGLETLHRSLTADRALIRKFVQASSGSNLGLSMFGPEVNMREKFAYLQVSVIDRMVQAYAAQRNLPESQARMVGKAIAVSMVLAPDNRKNFHNLVVFLDEYQGHKLEVTGQRIAAITRALRAGTVQPAS